uniref:Uncharacterized protein n=1 Tax=Kalanchoe fedtschenkoi TaxID=63787 RepID=A0A7N0T2R6_KALFE
MLRRWSDRRLRRCRFFENDVPLDGCFILQFMRMITGEKGLQIGNVMKSNDVAFAYRDLFLLENQVPFLVLEALMPEKEAMMTMFCQDTPALPPETIRYLPTIKKFIGKKVGQRGSRAGDNLHPKPMYLLDLYRSQLVNGKDDASTGETRSWTWYGSAKELKTVGIHFVPSRTQSFQSNLCMGTLRLPQLIVDDSTKSKLLNMVAFETCPDAPKDFDVTSYICLMDDLIDQAEDVAELRSKGVLGNLLGSDQKVAKLFNEMRNDLVPNSNAYSEVRRQIVGHFKNKNKNKLNVWIAQFCDTHFSSPWTIIGLFAAIFVIALTFTQTYFTVFPRKSDDKPAAPPSASPH